MCRNHQQHGREHKGPQLPVPLEGHAGVPPPRHRRLLGVQQLRVGRRHHGAQPQHTCAVDAGP